MSETSTVKVLGMSGSLRRASFNTAALRAACELAPEGVTIETIDLAPLPIYNDDVRLQGYPPAVQHLRERIKAADAVLFVTPEYNYSVSAPMKNAIDWVSRPPDPPLNWKPCAIMSASTSLLGGGRAQYHLRHMLVSTNSFALNTPQVYITEAPKKFDAEGRLVDQGARDLIKQLLAELRNFTLRFRSG